MLNHAKAALFTLASLLCLTTSYVTNAEDSYTDANLEQVESTHLYLDLFVNFDEKRLEGFVEHTLEWSDKAKPKLVVDTRDLVIKSTYALLNGQWRSAKFELGKVHPVKGAPLTIYLPGAAEKVRIHYHSTPKASGLQWLTKAQTAGKQYPFMFSQSQAIHARSWIPVQDTPAMRVTYSARIATPKPLLAVMSADNSANTEKDGDYHFSMPQAIPPYLIAIGVGDLEYKAMSKQTAIYAESYILDDAVAEFNDTQEMMDQTTNIYGDYAWGRYDLLVLPPSFPFGGMENPRLSFITPTVIAGDKSLVNLIAHELAHSWSGNLVTNATWEDLWLNEGFTSYVENRIMEEVFGEDRAVMEQALAADSLNGDLASLDKDDTRLKLSLNGRDPDVSFSEIPYVKGQLFLIYLEQKFGRDKFDPFVKQYFDDYAFLSLTTKDFVKYVKKHLTHKYPGIVSDEKLQEWIFGTGLPADAPQPKSDAFKKVKQSQHAWLEGKAELSSLSTEKWTVHEWLYFINELPRNLSEEHMLQLDQSFNLTNSKNAEIAFAWFNLAIENGYQAINPKLDQYLSSIGRGKLIVPLYKRLSEGEKRAWAHEVYKKARPGYHPLAQSRIDPFFK
ncbi:M1 family metallopeptidase [Flocculibacter collagenilyticus]|uniref:M1 family metallopeptidase n=1 Tax=Flocculibacter collagenilyticus TaxID=2744479 RepID=UPI0018F5EB3E|nr:M1 family metallopeptidase [Flocculibacter collagenilyticus]